MANRTSTTTSGRALVPVVVQGEPWMEWQPSIQNAGVDTIEFSFDVEISESMWMRLEEEREIAQLLMQTRKAIHVPDWLNAASIRQGPKVAIASCWKRPRSQIKLLKGVPNRPPIYVEMRAYGLHTHEGGAIGACDAACAFIRETLLPIKIPHGERRSSASRRPGAHG